MLLMFWFHFILDIPSCSLTGKLPFEDGYFDFVHIYRIAWGIDERKVSIISFPFNNSFNDLWTM